MVAEAGDGDEALAAAQTTHPDIALLDLAMPRVDGVGATRKISATCPETRIVILSASVDRRHVVQAVRAGAVGYVAKPATCAQMLAALDAVLSERRAEAFAGVESVQEPVGPETLTSREREVLSLVAEGYSSASVAIRLGLSVRTVETHRQTLMNKLGVHSVVGLTRYAVAHGL